MAEPQIEYIVTGPCAFVDTTSGASVFVLRDGAVPIDAEPEHVEHLLSLELIGKYEPVKMFTTPVDDGPTLEGDAVPAGGTKLPEPPKPAPHAGK